MFSVIFPARQLEQDAREYRDDDEGEMEYRDDAVARDQDEEFDAPREEGKAPTPDDPLVDVMLK